MSTFALRPLDTLFFRDGRPYNQDDPSQAEAASVFPPFPPTVVGAVRAALARAIGSWDAAALGDGVDWQAGDRVLGPLRFAGPHVLRGGEPLFPAPLDLVAGRDGNDTAFVTRLAPTRRALDTDLGAVRLPAPMIAGNGYKVLEDYWLAPADMAKALGGARLASNDFVCSSRLWQAEPRVGIRRDPARRSTAERALYAAVHARPAADVALAVEVTGLREIRLGASLAPLGGEGRGAWIEQRDGTIALPAAPALEPGKDGVLRYTVVLITPADLGETWPGPGGRIVDAQGGALPGEVVSACTGRAIGVGGWDGLGNRPLPLRPLAPAGSIWFLEARAEEAEAAAAWHGRAIGRATAWGFGRVLIGRWEPAEENA